MLDSTMGMSRSSISCGFSGWKLERPIDPDDRVPSLFLPLVIERQQLRAPILALPGERRLGCAITGPPSPGNRQLIQYIAAMLEISACDRRSSSRTRPLAVDSVTTPPRRLCCGRVSPVGAEHALRERPWR